MRTGISIATMAAFGLLMMTPAMAETDEAFILNTFPPCKGAPVFSPYASGAVGAVEAAERDAWYQHLKPIKGAPCVLNNDYGNVTFCGVKYCRNIKVQ